MSVFEPTNEIPPASGETTPPAPDVNVLEKRLQDKDAFILQLQRENAEAREALKTAAQQDEIKRLLEEVRQSRVTPPQVAQPSTETAAAPAFKDEDLVARIKQVQEATRSEEVARENIRVVDETLLSTFGTIEKAREVLTQKAAELKVPVTWLQDMAARSPNAFFAATGLSSEPASGFAPPSRSDVNPAAMANLNPAAKPGTHAYYENLRRTDKSRYFSPAVQNQRFKDAQKLGDSFFQ